jgi:hypothetical protein
MTISRRTFKQPASELPQDAPAESADAPTETGAADVTPAADGPLQRAQASLAATDAELSALLAARAEALAADDDVRAMELDGEIAAKERLRKVQLDKVGLRQAEAERAATEQRAAQKAETIAGIEALLAQRDEAGAELAAHIGDADRAFVRMIELGREIRTRWQFAQHDANPAMLTENALVQAIPHEFYRLTARPHPLGGKILTDQLPGFPAASKAERFEDAQMPAKITPLVRKLEAASALASRVMREGFSTNRLSVIPSGPASPADAGQSTAPATAAEPLPQVSPIRAEPNPELSRLLSRQNQLVSRAMSEADEAEYAENGRQIAAMS